MARFRHPNIVPVHGLGRLADGGYFMVMDLIDGHDLTKLCDAGDIPPSTAAKIVAHVADAVQHAHDRGVIHRDMKPGNVLIDSSGHVFVTDFGFAWTEADAVVDAESIAGTVGFMAPEQMDRSLGPIGPATDVYGLGAILFAMCFGRPSVASASISECLDDADSLTEAWTPDELPESAPNALRAICDRCLARDWRSRFASAAEVAIALRALEPAD